MMNYVVEYWNGGENMEIVFKGSEEECCEWEEKNNFIGEMNLEEEGMMILDEEDMRKMNIEWLMD